MKAKQHIINWLKETVKKYPFLHFRYEHISERHKHLVCVYPEHKLENWDAYCTDEMAFQDIMDELFQEETLLFCDNEELFSCSTNALEVRHSSLELAVE